MRNKGKGDSHLLINRLKTISFFIFFALTFNLILPIVLLAKPSYSKFLIHDFAKDYKFNFARGESYLVFDGQVNKNAPWAKKTIIKDRVRGRALKIFYNVEEGAISYHINVRQPHLYERYNAISFYARGDAGRVKVVIRAIKEHYYVIPISDEWEKITIPFNRFSAGGLFDMKSMQGISFLIESTTTEKREGIFYLDDVYFEVYDEKGKPDFDRPTAVRVQSPSEPPHSILELKAQYRHNFRRKKFLGLRFEISQNRKEWFYVGEDLNKNDRFFSIMWDHHAFPSGSYYVRAVALYENEGRGVGQERRFEITNAFKFDDLLDQMQRKAIRYFINEKNPLTNLIHASSSTDEIVSTQGCGFGLAVLCIAAERNILPRTAAARMALSIIETYANSVPKYNSFLPAYVSEKGEHALEPKGDIIATAHFLMGVMAAAEYFDNRFDKIEDRISKLAKTFLQKIQWRNALVVNNDRNLLAETIDAKGRTKGMIEGYRDGMIAYLLGISSELSSLPRTSWADWAQTYTYRDIHGETFLIFPSLYAHQYPHLWLDLKGYQDEFINYYRNGVLATYINREFGLRTSKTPSEIWGYSACYGPKGYVEYGAPPPYSHELTDGTICPAAVAGSLMFAPAVSRAALYAMYEAYGEKIWKEYGLIESFNAQEDYFKEYFTARNLGALVIAIENDRNGFVQSLIMQNTMIKRALRYVDLKKY